MSFTASPSPGSGPDEGGDDTRRVLGLKIKQEHFRTASNFSRIFSYATTWDRVVLALSVIAASLSGVSMPLLYLLFGKLTEEFTGFFRQGATETEAVFTTTVNKYVLYIVYIFLAKVCLLYIANLGFRALSLRVSSAVRLAYLRALFGLPISTLDILPAGQTAAIVTTTAATLQAGISERLGQLCASLSMVISGVVLSLFFNPALTAAVGLGLAAIVLVYSFAAAAALVQIADIQAVDFEAASVATDAFSSIRMLVACGAQAKMLARYSQVVDKTRRMGAQLAWILAVQHGSIYLIINATFALAFWAALKMYQHQLLGATGPQALIVVLLCVMTIASSIGQIAGPLTAASQAAEAYRIFHTIIDAPKTVYGTKTLPNAGAEDIFFENVNFTYATRPDVRVLGNLSLCFPAGKVTAIVGPSGSGKSTIVSILQRWYEFNGDPDTNPVVMWLRNGQVSIGGLSFRDLDLKWWRNQIGLVQQDNFLFNTTIYKNVEYGLIGTQWENASFHKKAMMVRSACQDAFADDFISRLPDGYDTIVGQSGLHLSGGQRQRIAIARAIIKQPKILILDEATSAIDVRSEQIVQAALDRASQGRTTIVIAHRLGTIRKADNIIVLKAGILVQQGSHRELMGQVGGAYHQLATSQAVHAHAHAPAPVQDEQEDVLAAGKEEVRSPTLHPDGSSEASYFDEKTASVADPLYTATLTEKDSFLGQDSASSPPSDDLNYDSRSDGTLLNDADADVDEASHPIVIQPPSDGRFGSFFTLLREQKSRWLLYSLVLLAAIGAGSATPVQAFLFAQLISLFSFRGDVLSDLTNYWTLVFFYLAVAAGLCHFFLVWSTTTVGLVVTRTYRKEYFLNMISKPMGFFDACGNGEGDNSVGSLVSRLAGDPFQLQQLLGANTAAVLVSGCNVVGCAALSLAFGWKLAAAAFATSMPVMVAAAVFRVRQERRLDAGAAAVFARSAALAAESIAAVRTVTSLTMEDDVCGRYHDVLRFHIRDALHDARLSVAMFSLSDSVALLCMAFVLWLGTRLLASHEYTPFQYVLVYNAVVQGAIATGAWLSVSPNIAAATAAADRVLAARYDCEEDENDYACAGELFPGATMSVDEEEGTGAGTEKDDVAIDFRDVWFSYPSRPDVAVLKGLDVQVRQGQTAAFVGPSGSGKTTVISLIERFYRPQSGSILYHGRPVHQLHLPTYRSRLALVAQEPCLFSGSLRDNILMGVHHLDNNDSDHGADPGSIVHAAARAAGIHDFITSLPDGYGTQVGTSGLSLSGGQKQRVSIARAMARKPAVLLLDEATSSLDGEAEARVQRGVMMGCDTKMGRSTTPTTTVMVAHRLATVQAADVIFVLDDGAVVEKGDHASLLARKGVYYQMCQSQSLDQ